MNQEKINQIPWTEKLSVRVNMVVSYQNGYYRSLTGKNNGLPPEGNQNWTYLGEINRYETVARRDAANIMSDDANAWKLALGIPNLIGDSLISINSVSELREIDLNEGEIISLLGYHKPGDKPMVLYKYTSENFDTLLDDGGSIIKTSIGSWVAEFKNEVHTCDFGATENNPLNPTDLAVSINRAFNYALDNDVKKTVISPGTHIVKSETIFYKVPDSVIEYMGILKLQDNDSTEEITTSCRLIGYTASNITVINQMIDGNRENQIRNTQVGTQFSFTAYGYIDRIVFKGGYCINSIQSHCQFIAKEVFFENYKMIKSGEHGIYYSLSVDGLAGEYLKMTNCEINDIGIVAGGHCVSSRAVKRGDYINCIFNEGITPKGDFCAGISIYYTYRNAFPAPADDFRHVFTNCKFIPCTTSIYSAGVRLGSSTNNPYTIDEYIKQGKGIYMYGCSLVSNVGLGIINADKCIFRYPEGNTISQVRLPVKISNCKFYNLFNYVPTELLSLEAINCDFYNATTDNRVVFDTNSLFNLRSKLVWSFVNCNFYDYTTQTSLGIIRNSGSTNELVEIIVTNNKLYGCTGAVFVNVGANNNNFIAIGNSDVTNSGVKLRFVAATTKPLLVRNNDFIKDAGNISERPTSDQRYVGMQYYLSDTNSIQMWDGTAWNRLNYPVNATTSVNGLVKQSTLVNDVTSADPVSDSESTASDVAGIVVDLNDLITKYNTVKDLVIELKRQFNLSLATERISGQRSTI